MLAFFVCISTQVATRIAGQDSQNLQQVKGALVRKKKNNLRKCNSKMNRSYFDNYFLENSYLLTAEHR